MNAPGLRSGAFRFEAVDAQGRLRPGAARRRQPRAQVRDRLRADGLTPTAVDRRARSRTPLQRTRLPCRGARASHAAARVARAVRACRSTRRSSPCPSRPTTRASRKLVDAIRTHVLAGESLPAALSRFPRTFSPLYRGLIGAGTETGRLPEVLARLADYLDARLALRQKFIVALIYPALVTRDRVRRDRGAGHLRRAAGRVRLPAEPADAAAAHAGADRDERVLSRDRLAVARALAVGGVAFALAWRRDRTRARLHRALLRLPGVGRLAASLDTARYASTLAILVGSGAPLLRSLDAATEVVRMLPLARAARTACALVREGVSLSRALKEQKAFPPVSSI